MIIPTKEIKQVNEYIFHYGCIVVEDKNTAETHPHISVANYKVMKIVRSLCSKGFLDREFVWRHAYYTITPEGIEWLRKKLYLGAEEYPMTHTGAQISPEKEIIENPEEVRAQN